MDIKFTGKYKSITPFEWNDIPKFAVITGPNGTGKSQLLELINGSITGSLNNPGIDIKEDGQNLTVEDVTYLKGEWQLQNANLVSLATIQQKSNARYNEFIQINPISLRQKQTTKKASLYKRLLSKIGKPEHKQTTQKEFDDAFPEIFIEQESQLSQTIGEIFYNYRLSEIECQAKKIPEDEIISTIGYKPWDVLREIIKSSKLPFEINDPSDNGIRDGFQLKLTHTILNEPVNFSDLSSGEKVLISLMMYLYNSQEKHFFPKLLLMDEPDAHLHPSMSQQFLNVIKNVFVDKFGVQVIMTTHSPSTVVLAPLESIHEMSRTEPRIRKSISKNSAVSTLTSGLVYVGDGTKYYLVEDTDDVDFYSYIHGQLTSEGILDFDIPLVFIPASTKDKSGGKDAVQNWVKKLHDSGIEDILRGLIDEDYGNEVSNGVHKIQRYSIENYLCCPLLVYAVLVDKEKAPHIEGIDCKVGEEYKIKSFSSAQLQKIYDAIISMVEPGLSSFFPDFDVVEETKREEIVFSDSQKVMCPVWLLGRRGKTILNEVYNKVFSSPVINHSALFKAMRKLNMFPKDIVDSFIELRSS